VGAGYKLTSSVGLNINYMVDFNHAFEEDYDGGERNSGFAFTLGYAF